MDVRPFWVPRCGPEASLQSPGKLAGSALYRLGPNNLPNSRILSLIIIHLILLTKGVFKDEKAEMSFKDEKTEMLTIREDHKTKTC